jgi:type IV pilus assembly protein PilX
MKPFTRGPSRQGGATLIIGLVLLLVMTLLAVSVMNGATFGLTMAGNAQYGENAFQLAETGVEVAINDGPFSVSGGPKLVALTAVTDLDGNDIGQYQAQTAYQECTPAMGFSEDAGTADSFKAYHFQITSTGTSARAAQSAHTQDFFLVGPSGCL